MKVEGEGETDEEKEERLDPVCLLCGQEMGSAINKEILEVSGVCALVNGYIKGESHFEELPRFDRNTFTSAANTGKMGLFNLLIEEANDDPFCADSFGVLQAFGIATPATGPVDVGWAVYGLYRLMYFVEKKYTLVKEAFQALKNHVFGRQRRVARAEWCG